MKKDTEKTEVIFRKYKKEGDILAIFPHNVQASKGYVLCYQHTGQYSEGDYSACLDITRPAIPSEYEGLQKELETDFGYNLQVIKRQNRNKFYKSYNDFIDRQLGYEKS